MRDDNLDWLRTELGKIQYHVGDSVIFNYENVFDDCRAQVPCTVVKFMYDTCYELETECVEEMSWHSDVSPSDTVARFGCWTGFFAPDNRPDDKEEINIGFAL